MKNENSLIEIAVALLESEKKPYDLYQLFDVVTKDLNLSEDQKTDYVTKFYTDLTTSAKFVYTGDNQWDLKANQKIELWEKDGSFYKEYTKVDLPEEYKEQAKPKAKVKPKVSKAEEVEEPVVVVVEPVVEEPVVEVVEAVVEPVATEVPTPQSTDPEVIDTYEEEVFEDFDDFDEEKYNEYMDTYEDKYDK